MGNEHYIKGRALEYRLIKRLKEKGYLVFRTAGSHTCVDVLAMSSKKIIMFQCKKTNKKLLDIDNLFREDAIIELTMLDVPDNGEKALCIKQSLSRDMLFFKWDTLINQWVPTNY